MSELNVPWRIGCIDDKDVMWFFRPSGKGGYTLDRAVTSAVVAHDLAHSIIFARKMLKNYKLPESWHMLIRTNRGDYLHYDNKMNLIRKNPYAGYRIAECDPLPIVKPSKVPFTKASKTKKKRIDDYVTENHTRIPNDIWAAAAWAEMNGLSLSTVDELNYFLDKLTSLPR